jgi:hypothetical protein
MRRAFVRQPSNGLLATYRAILGLATTYFRAKREVCFPKIVGKQNHSKQTTTTHQSALKQLL